MDLSWANCFGAFWVFPLLWLLFMAVMMIAGGGMPFRCCHGGGLWKEQHDATRRDLDG